MKNKEYLLHKDIFFSEKIVKMSIDRFIKKNILHFSKHFYNAINSEEIRKLNVGDVKEKIYNSKKNIDINSIFEVGFTIENKKLIISKFCYRISLTNLVDLCIVIGFSEDEELDDVVRTIWLNDSNDKHITLKKNNYICNIDALKELFV